MQKLSKFVLFLFLFLIISYFKTNISFAITSCPTAKIQCGQLDAGGGCASPCLRVVTSVGGKGPSWCACQEPISPPVSIACGGSCQTSADCGSDCAFCRASGPGTGFTCQTSTTNSDEAFPGISFPCEKVKDPEFHSLRPYQAAVCGDANKALYCSNELKFIESFDLTSKCDREGRTSDFDCDPGFNVDEHNLYVELTDAMFPILGNTEQVKNSREGTEEFDDATKVNEYASWYLSGVNNRAEYGENTDERVVNFSGPIQKLLPKIIQEAERIKTIKNSVKEVPSDAEEEESSSSDSQVANHNQIVVCGDSNLGWFGDLFNIGKITPVPCYGGDEKFRLKDGDGDQGWYDGDLSFWNTIANEIVGKIITVLPSVPEDIITKSVLNHWNKRTPPLPWEDDPFEKRPMTELEYKKYYNEWRGKTCVIVPLINFLVCFDNILVANKWADLYQYIPLSNTTDKKGAERILDVRFEPSKGTEIAHEKYNEAGKKSAPLYFAHTQEVKESSELLNTTYLPKDYESEPLPETTEKNVCSAVNVRANKGDDLFPGDRVEGDTKEMIIPGVTYDITQVLCKVTKTVVKRCPPKGAKCFDEIVYTYHCNAEVAIVVPTDVKVPNADEIFATTVADSGSTFRKIFPKVEEGAPVSCIADMPTVTSVTYNADESDTPRGDKITGSLEFKVKKYPEDSAGDNPELTFPHIGSVYEYFLKGIQTALRPKGYGEPIANGNCKPAEEETSETGNCRQWLFEKDKSGKYYYDKIIAAASATKCNGKSLNPFWAMSIALNENGGLMSDNLKGDSKSHFGCNVSQLQTIEEKITCMTNTLRNDCLAGKSDEQTLIEYGYPADYKMFPMTVLNFGGLSSPPLFGTGFNTTQLKQNLLNADWVVTYKSKAPIFCPNSPVLESKK